MVIELLLQHFISEVDAQLLKAVVVVNIIMIYRQE
jgi:hypothetical protein